MNINGRTAVYGIIGNPVEHTMSPAIHNHISQALGIDSVYVPFRADGNLENIVKGLYSLGVRGINVTVPYKTDIMRELIGVDDVAGAVGAVNTLKYTEKGFYGYNTDVMGLERELESEGISLSGRHVVILGAGGAARAAAFMCISKSPATLTIVNRTRAKAEDIRASLLAYARDNNAGITEDAVSTMEPSNITGLPGSGYIAFQCTKVGLYPDVDSCIINDEGFFEKTETGIDLIYKPETTLFMKRVMDSGGKAYNGLKMLVYQAVCSYEIWNGISVPENVAEDVYKILKGER